MRNDWIKNRLDEIGENQKGLAEHLGLPPPRITEIIKGERQVTAKEVLGLSSFLHLPEVVVLRRLFPQGKIKDEPAEYQLTEDLREESDWKPEPDLPVIAVGAMRAGIVDVAGVEFASIGVYDARFSAGPGSIVEPGQEPEGYRLFEAQWLRALTSAAPDRLAVVRVDGDSMRETLDDGDFVLIDRSETRISRQGIYALRVGESCWVKRLSVSLKDRIVKVISDNPRYPEDQLQEDELELLGRVLMIVARKV